MVLLPRVFYPKDCIANTIHLLSVNVALKIGAELLHVVDSAACHIFYVVVKCTEQLYSHLLLTLLSYMKGIIWKTVAHYVFQIIACC